MHGRAWTANSDFFLNNQDLFSSHIIVHSKQCNRLSMPPACIMKSDLVKQMRWKRKKTNLGRSSRKACYMQKYTDLCISKECLCTLTNFLKIKVLWAWQISNRDSIST